MKKGILGTLIVSLVVLIASTAMAAPSPQALASRSTVANVVRKQVSEAKAQRIALPDGEHGAQRIALPDGEHGAQRIALPDGEHSAQRIALPDGEHSAQRIALPDGEH